MTVRRNTEMKKIGLVICYFHENYGSMLQAYATQRIFDKLDLPNEAVYCHDPHMYMTMPKWSYYYHKLTNKDVLIDKIKRTQGKFVNRLLKTEFYSRQAIRSEKFKEFSRKTFRVSRPYANRRELMEDSSNYAAFVVGSDQLWSPANIDNDFYTLTFVPDEIPKIAYATSFGTSSIPRYQYKKAKEFLDRFDSISVREESGRRLVEKLSGKRAEVVLDPTLLLQREEWERFSCRPPIIEGEYIFCYFLGNNRKGRRFAEKLRAETGCRIAALLHMDEYIPEDENFADLTPYDIGPEEFVNLIRHASYVCTDSFHGTVFSIIFQRRFFTFDRFDSSSTISTNTRIETLLGMAGLESRRMREDSLPENVFEEICFSTAEDKIEKKREESLAYLAGSLAGALELPAGLTAEKINSIISRSEGERSDERIDQCHCSGI